MSLALDRFVRKLIPSVAKLSYNPVAKILLDIPDPITQLLYPSSRGLYLRTIFVVRVGWEISCSTIKPGI